MSTNNKVFQILVTSGNSGLAVVGKKVSELTNGQLGLFDAETNLAIDGATPVKEFYFAVGGVDENAVQFSAGQAIQADFVRNVVAQDYVAPESFSFELKDYKALNDTDYGIKLEFRNMQIYMRQGTNQFTKTYAVTTSSNEDVEPNLDLAKKLLAEFNLDESGMFTAAAYDPTANTLIADLDVWATTHVGVSPKIRVTAVDLAIREYLQINPRYYYPRQTVILPSLVDGFTSEAVTVTVNEAVAEQGNAYEIKNKEYKAGGWNGKPGPYRTSSHLGFPYEGISYKAVDGENYLQLNIVYDFFSTSGWGEYLNNLLTTIAVPTTSTTTIASLYETVNSLLGTSFVSPEI